MILQAQKIFLTLDLSLIDPYTTFAKINTKFNLNKFHMHSALVTGFDKHYFDFLWMPISNQTLTSISLSLIICGF
jgi:hypothetical protein